MESSEETGFQAQEGPILCINNCGFFGSSTTMNMCSKCHKDMILKQQETMLAAASIDNIVNNGSTSNGKAPLFADAVIEAECIELKQSLLSSENAEMKAKEGPTRCTSCFKRVGLTGFKCKCGEFFCSVHRYADKHACTFDYRAAGRNAIAKANPVVKAEKLDKI